MTDKDRLAAGLAACSDTEAAFAEWDRRKAQAEVTRRSDYLLPDGSRTPDLQQAIALWGPVFDRMLAGKK
jgi:hypothetical protein